MSEIRKITERFLFSVGITVCVLMFFCLGITAKQRTEYNMYLKPYSVMSLKNKGQNLEMKIDKESYVLDYSSLKSLYKYEDYLSFSPLSGGYHLFKTVKQLFEDKNIQ